MLSLTTKMQDGEYTRVRVNEKVGEGAYCFLEKNATFSSSKNTGMLAFHRDM